MLQIASPTTIIRWHFHSFHPATQGSRYKGIFTHQLQGRNKIIVRTLDTDVLVITFSVFARLKE